MRNHRVALVVSLAAVAAVLTMYPGAAAPIHTEDASWTTSGPPQRTMLLSSQSLKPLVVFVSAVEAWQVSQYLSAEAAAARAAQAQATIRTAQSTATTSQPTPGTSTCSPGYAGCSGGGLNCGAGAGGSCPDAYAQWSRVATCEEGGWIGSAGSAYPNSLGIMSQAWYAHGGGSDESPAAQIAVAQSLIDSLVGTSIQGTTVYVGFVPDQSGCSSW